MTDIAPSPRIPHVTPAKAPKNISDAELMAALKECAGVYVLTAKKLNCDRSNVRMRVERSPELQEFIKEIRAAIVDQAEGVVIDALNKKDKATARWVLEHLGRDRGYVRRQEHSGPDGGAIPLAQDVRVTIEYVDPPRIPEDEEIPV